MPRVDASDSAVFHDNYTADARSLYYNIMLGQQNPVGSKRLTVGYVRFAMMFRARSRAQRLVTPWPLGLTSGQKIIVVGAGFGWLQEALEELITADIVSIDTSPWVHSVKDQDETSEIVAALDAAGITNQTERNAWRTRCVQGARAKRPILDEDIRTGASRGRVKQALGLQGNANADICLTEQVLPWLDDSECQALSNAAHSIANQVVHIVTPFAPSTKPEPRPLWNWKHFNDLSPTRPDLEAEPWYTTTSWKALLPNDLFVSPHNYEVI